MGRYIVYCIKVCFLVIFLAICYSEAENTKEPRRTRNSPYTGLVPFLRTGRSRFHLPLTEEEFGDDSYKRAKLAATIMAFPRVGRREDARTVQKKEKESSNANTGVWFGPRLGRIQKRLDSVDDIPLAYYYINGYAPSLGRESEESNYDLSNPSGDVENNERAVMFNSA